MASCAARTRLQYRIRSWRDNIVADAMSRLCTNNKPEIETVVQAAIDGPGRTL